MNAPEVFELPKTLVDRLTNWAIASRSRTGGSPATCGSVEGRYKSPQVWHAPGPKLIIDYFDADKVELAWRALPMKHKMMLKWSYVYPVHPRIAERRAGVKAGSYKEAKRLAEFKIAVVLSNDCTKPHLDD